MYILAEKEKHYEKCLEKKKMDEMRKEAKEGLDIIKRKEVKIEVNSYSEEGN